MNYYQARTIDTLPKLVFDLVATSFEELQEQGLETSAIVVTENRLTDTLDPGYISYQYGICHFRNVDGALVARAALEITDAQATLATAETVQKTREIETDLEFEKITYDGREFPMTPGAVLIYQAIFASPAITYNIAASNGSYALTAGKIDAFKTAYYGRLLEINNAKIPPPVA